MSVQNVIIVCDYGYIEGGAARIAHETAFALQRRGVHVAFFCAVGPISEDLKNSSLEVVCLNQDDILQEKSRLKGVLRGIKNKRAETAFKGLLNKFNPQNTVIHVHTWTKGVSSVIFKVARVKKFKVVITVHDYFLICPNGGLFNYPKSRICELKPMSAKCLVSNCDARSYPQKVYRVLRQKSQNRNIRKNKAISYIFISKFSRREFLRRYNQIPLENQYFLPNMINFPKERDRIACENNDEYLFIGGLTEVKGIRNFCEAVTKVGVKAVVIGQGLLKEELEKKYPNIEFVGWKSKEEMTPYLKRARCLIFPSIWYECSPLTPLEVMSFGIPVICSDLNASSEYIRENENGFLFNGQDLNSLVSAINRSADNELMAGLSDNVYRNFNDEEFSEKSYLDGLVSIYEGNNDRLV